MARRSGSLWGEIAWQLGGAEGYDLVAEADADRHEPWPGHVRGISAASGPASS